MVAVAEVAADLAVSRAGVFPSQVHGDHPRIGQRPGAAVGFDGVGVDLKELADRALDLAQTNRLRRVADRVPQGGLGQCQIKPLTGQEGVGDHAVERPFKLAHAGAQVLGDVVEHGGRNTHAPGH